MSAGHTIVRLRKKYTTIRLVESVLFGVAAGLMALALGWLITGSISVALVLAAVVTIIVVTARIRHLGLLSINNERIAFFLNRQFAGLKDSSDLLILPNGDLSDLQQIQAHRTLEALSGLGGIILPNRLVASVVTLVISAGLGWMLLQLEPASRSITNPVTPLTDGQSPVSRPEPAALSEIGLTIQPPRYTGLSTIHAEKMSALVPEESICSWEITFTGSIERATLQFSDGDSITLTGIDASLTAKRRISESQIYRLQWDDNAGRHSTEYFELRVKADEPPRVQILELAQFTRLKWDEKKFIEVPVTLQDDFGLTQGHIVATVSKGSGESVKFREEKLPFDSPSRISGKKLVATRRIDFSSLGMDPGDEVYFYAEGVDNKEPGHQRTRTETFFVSLQDTASNVMTVDASLGVDLMPDYFRSQRQIIIDTEKLLKDQPKISKQVFNSTSNELGYDQKVLRLKYGQFLGEEFETNIGAPAHVDEETDEEDEQDPTKKFGHQHDKDNEHNLVAGKKPETGHDHEEEDEKDPIAAFKHNHDNAEEATFFTQSVRAKLKAALTLMWEAELQLRLFAPKASLPVQYKILNLLKEISQDSRVYVHRMGFDPPPLKEERRLTGDLAEVNNPLAIGGMPPDPSFPAIRKALSTIQVCWQSDSVVVTDKLKRDLEGAAVEIAAISLARPGNYLNHLSLIRSIIDDKIDASNLAGALEEIQSTFWSILPPVDQSPKRTEGTRHPFDERLLEELKKPAND